MEIKKEISLKRLVEIYFELYKKGANNINLVTPTHFAPHIAESIIKAKNQGLNIPFVYNSSGYERVEILQRLEGLIDVYLPDLKYISGEKSLKYSKAENYFDCASRAILEMKRQCGENIYDSDGIIKKGLIVRHLILPKNTNQSIEILKWMAENLGTDTAISLMAQYTPYGKIENNPELQRKITEREYNKVLTFAVDIGFKNIFTQEFASSSEEYIPDFDLTGV